MEKGFGIGKPMQAEIKQATRAVSPGKQYRDDLIFYYRILVSANDWINLRKILWVILKDGWRNINNWKLITFPLLGKNLVSRGVRIKKWFKNAIPAT